jgi:cell division protein ZapA
VKTSPGGVTISILGKELMVACPDDERESLAAAARYLDQRMREIQDSGKVIGTERCAVMAALNLSNELLQLRQQFSGERFIKDMAPSAVFVSAPGPLNL